MKKISVAYLKDQFCDCNISCVHEIEGIIDTNILAYYVLSINN